MIILNNYKFEKLKKTQKNQIKSSKKELKPTDKGEYSHFSEKIRI